MSDAPETDVDGDDVEYDDDMTAAEAVLTHVLEHLVDDEDAIEIEVDQNDREIRFVARVDKADMGRVIGRRGRVAQAIRELVRAAASRDGLEADVDFAD